MTERTEKRNDKMLTAREAAFVAYYVEGGGVRSTITDCAKRAGFKSSSGLLQRPHVRAEIKRLLGRVMAKKQITAERVIEELGKIAFANIDDFVDDDYHILAKPGRKKMAAVESVATTTRRMGDESEATVTNVKLKMCSKLDALNALGRHFGLFTDKVELTGDLAERLRRAQDRLENDGAEPSDSDGEEDA